MAGKAEPLRWVALVNFDPGFVLLAIFLMLYRYNACDSEFIISSYEYGQEDIVCHPDLATPVYLRAKQEQSVVVG
jgi:hypothetical protein